MKVHHLNILATEADFNEVNRVGWNGHPRFKMHAALTMGFGDKVATKAVIAWAAGHYKEVCEMSDDRDLNAAFYFTQNLEQPWNGVNRSTSVGDIIEKDGELFLVKGIGFESLGTVADLAVMA